MGIFVSYVVLRIFVVNMVNWVVLNFRCDVFVIIVFVVSLVILVMMRVLGSSIVMGGSRFCSGFLMSLSCVI